jgi:hypothetical protein
MTYSKPEPGKPILIEIDGTMVELRFSLRALKALDADHQVSLFKGDGLSTAFQDAERMSVILYYGLRERNPAVTQEWVDEHVDASMLLDLTPMLIYAATGRWHDVERAIKNTMGPETGLVSGPSDDTTSVVAKPNSGA